MASLFRAGAVASARTQLLASTTTKRWGHNVRLIAVKDLPHGRGYKGDVVSVKAGFARNFLVPKKLAIYATPQNFDKHGIVDPDVETEEERVARLIREASFDQREEQLLKEADMLRHYLRNKVVSSGGSMQVYL
jgi:ribosomal protein L9